MEPNTLTPAQVQEKFDQGQLIAFVDSRSQPAWDKAEMKLPGAIRVPPEQVAEHLDEIPRDRTIVTYGDSAHDESAIQAAKTLAAKGWNDVHTLSGGFEGWQKSGYPLEEKESG